MASSNSHAAGLRLISLGRISSSRQTGMKDQLATNRAFIRASGATLAAEFEDAKSGMDAQRHGLLLALKMMIDGEADGIVVFDASRMARTNQGVEEAMGRAAMLGTVFTSSTGRRWKPAESRNAEDIVLSATAGMMAEFTRVNLIKTMNRKKVELRATGRGRTEGKAPFGYVNDKTAKNGMREHPEQQEVIALMKELRWGPQRMSARKLADHLNSLGIMSPGAWAGTFPDAPWSRLAVDKVLDPRAAEAVRRAGANYRKRRAANSRAERRAQVEKYVLANLAELEQAEQARATRRARSGRAGSRAVGQVAGQVGPAAPPAVVSQG